MTIIKPMEKAFDDIKHIIIDILGSIQTGRANVKSTASLLYKNYDAVWPV